MEHRLDLLQRHDVGDGASQHFSSPLEDVQEIEANIEFGAGEFTLAALPRSSQDAVMADFNSNFGRELHFDYSPQGPRAIFTIEEEDGDISFPGFNRSIERKLAVSLASGVPIILDVNAGAGDIYLDLSGLEIEDFHADIGAAAHDWNDADVRSEFSDIGGAVGAEIFQAVRGKSGNGQGRVLQGFRPFLSGNHNFFNLGVGVDQALGHGEDHQRHHPAYEQVFSRRVHLYAPI